MKRLQPKEALIASLVVTFSLAAVPKPTAFFRIDSASAQSASPNSNTSLKIDGSSSTAVTTEDRVQHLKQQAPNTDVKVDYRGTDAALQAVKDGQIDVAAVGRPLTAAEKVNTTVVPQTRKKIAIVVGSDNSFTGNLTFEQFAKIFRGEITDWSEVGGPPGPIQLVDRPDSNDTRESLQAYDVFKQAPFQAAPGAIKLNQDDTDAMIKALGNRGISYAIADQVTDKPGVRIVPMHKTLPSDPRYPFSQPISYVYKGTPSPAAQTFLGIAASAPAAPAPVAPAPASPSAPAPAPAPAQTHDYSWLLWLLLLPILGGLLWWLLKNRSQPAAIAPVVAPKVVPVPPPAPAAPIVPVAEPPSLKLYEERLVADTTRQKVGDVAVSKHVETDQAEVSIPLEKERVIIERVVPTDAESVSAKHNEDAFHEGEITRIETYEETPDIHKETFVREEVSVRKEVEHDTVEAEATIRKEQLDIDTDGNPVVDDKSARRGS